MGKTDERLDELERRLAALEGAPRDLPSGRTPAVNAGRFWALEGLRERAPEGGGVLFTGSVELPDGPVVWQQEHPAAALLEVDWSPAADALDALSHPIRLLLLREVLAGRRTTAALGELEELATSGRLYHHLGPLLGAGWLRTTRRGQYEVPAERVVPLLAILAAALP